MAIERQEGNGKALPQPEVRRLIHDPLRHGVVTGLNEIAPIEGGRSRSHALDCGIDHEIPAREVARQPALRPMVENDVRALFRRTLASARHRAGEDLLEAMGRRAFENDRGDLGRGLSRIYKLNELKGPIKQRPGHVTPPITENLWLKVIDGAERVKGVMIVRRGEAKSCDRRRPFQGWGIQNELATSRAAAIVSAMPENLEAPTTRARPNLSALRSLSARRAGSAMLSKSSTWARPRIRRIILSPPKATESSKRTRMKRALSASIALSSPGEAMRPAI